MPTSVDVEAFRTPQDLVIELSPPRRIIIVGSCLAEAWSTILDKIEEPCAVSLYFTGHPLPEMPERPIADYDFQLLQFALRFVLPDGAFGRLAHNDLQAHDKLFDFCVAKLEIFVKYAIRWNKDHGILTFVMPFIVPQQNPMGRLMPRHDLRNHVYFVEKLNERLEGMTKEYKNCYYFEFNEVMASFGRRLIQEDHVMPFNHGSFVFDYDFFHDQQRLEPVRPATEIFGASVQPILRAAWRELVSMYRTVRQRDQVKLVVLDLDDTLWRGVAAEVADGQYATSEGWPKALWEACLFLKRRGILLAILSKNDENRIRTIWKTIFKGILEIEDFAILRIDWAPKAQNMAEILRVVNVLPGSVLYIDDNPVERAAVKAAFPDLRMLGGNPVTWRRILLASAETQVGRVTGESAARTEMMRAQVRREADRQAGDHAAFLASLEVRVQPIHVYGTEHPRFARALELINKTNQFNTTGGRWSTEAAAAAFAQGTRIFAFEVEDRYTAYGLVAVAVVARDSIEQLVMSCRVIGLGVEAAAIAVVVDEIGRSGHDRVQAALVKTERNLPCQDVFARCGFTEADDAWICPVADAPRAPSHVRLEAAGELVVS